MPDVVSCRPVETSAFVVPAPTGPPSGGWNSPSPSSYPAAAVDPEDPRHCDQQVDASCLTCRGPWVQAPREVSLSQIRRICTPRSASSSSAAFGLLPCRAQPPRSSPSRLLALLGRSDPLRLAEQRDGLDPGPIDAQVSSAGMALLSRSSSPLPGREVFFRGLAVLGSPPVGQRVLSGSLVPLCQPDISPSGPSAPPRQDEIEPLSAPRTKRRRNLLWPSPLPRFPAQQGLSKGGKAPGSASRKMGRYGEAFCLAPGPGGRGLPSAGPATCPSMPGVAARPSDSSAGKVPEEAGGGGAVRHGVPAVPMDSRMQFGQSSASAAAQPLTQVVKGV